MRYHQKKYKTINPISRYLIYRFHAKIKALLSTIHNCDSLLEVGCGEGRVLELLYELFGSSVELYGVDIDNSRLNHAKNNLAQAHVVNASVYALPFENKSQDFVLCTEVLEHLTYPEWALDEIDRVAKGWVILTVPDEPIWRILNMIRGANWRDCGNTPGHINHWSSKEFVQFVSYKMKVVELRSSLPWTLLLAKPV